mmetsp:Transcript_73049/g.116133  ORF Transcript_73049/g.116133 Transcript_73049/m.116133 type:complete len:231 (-) Transcript_73049:221-913(-)
MLNAWTLCCAMKSSKPLDLDLDEPVPVFDDPPDPSRRGSGAFTAAIPRCNDAEKNFYPQDQPWQVGLLDPPRKPEEDFAMEPVPPFALGGCGGCKQTPPSSSSPDYFLVKKKDGGALELRPLAPMAELLACEDQKLSPRPSYVTHDLAADFPAPPNRVMHDMVLEDLDGFLKDVKKSPKKLISIVTKHRGEEHDPVCRKRSRSGVAEVVRFSRNLVSVCHPSGRAKRTTI